jgi:hypothetical protein
MQNAMNLLIDFCSAYSQTTQHKTVRLCQICKMKLCIFTENAKQIFVFHQCAKLPFNLKQYLSKFERKTETVVDLSEAQVDSTGQTSLNQKKLMEVCL